jgi:hypothetical protein
MGKFTHEELKSLIYGALPPARSRKKVYTADFAMGLDIPYKDCEKAVRCLVRAGLVYKEK